MLIRTVRSLRNGADGNDGIVDKIRAAYADPADKTGQEQVRGMVKQIQEDTERRRMEEKEREQQERDAQNQADYLHALLFDIEKTAVNVQRLNFSDLWPRFRPVEDGIDEGRITASSDLWQAINAEVGEDKELLWSLPMHDTLTNRLEHMTLKRDEWLTIDMFQKRWFSTGTPRDGEETVPTLTGTTVETLVRMHAGAIREDDHRHAYTGACQWGLMDEFRRAVDDLSAGDATTHVRAAFTLAAFESSYRSGRRPIMPDPSRTDILHASRMASDATHLLSEYGGIQRVGFDIPLSALTHYVSKADGDFTTPGMIWDLKVRVNPPDGRQFLQILCYWIMLTAAEPDEKPIHAIGIVNPRLGEAWTANIGLLPPRVIRDAAWRIIGYPPYSDQYQRVRDTANLLRNMEADD